MTAFRSIKGLPSEKARAMRMVCRVIYVLSLEVPALHPNRMPRFLPGHKEERIVMGFAKRRHQKDAVAPFVRALTS